MMPGVAERRSFDYARAGTTDLFAALDVATGLVIHSIQRRHRAIEFKKFLNQIDQTVPDELDVHLICDNLSTHKTPAITAWLAAHPRFHLHFTPTSSSWLKPGRTLVWAAHRAPAPTRHPQQRELHSNTTSRHGSSNGTATPNPSSGSRPPTKSSKSSPDIYNEFLVQDTSGRCVKSPQPAAGLALDQLSDPGTKGWRIHRRVVYILGRR